MRSFIPQTFALAAIALLSQPFLLEAVDIENAKESKCFEIKNTVSLDMDWVMSHKTFYYPLMSRFDLYSAAVDLSGKKAEDLHEDELYYDSCLTFGLVEGGFAGRGFGRPDKFYSIKPVKGMEIYEFEVEGSTGRCYNTLTDNKTFAVSACCINDIDQMTWGIMSTQKQLPKETVKKIYDHAESLGFKREYFTGLRYDSCDFDKKKGKNEL